MSEYKDKYQLFEYFKSVKNPNLCRESVFQKRFEDIYADFKNSIFYSLDFSFKERLYLYFIDDYELTSSSKLEEGFENYLINSNIYFEKQYMSKLYPFACDFYIVDKNLYVEIQGNWTHGPHPFDKNNKEDISILNNWKEKNTPYYLSAIKNWTINDPHKREVAKNNKLNFLEIFTQDVNDLIKKFNDYYEQL